MKTKLNVRDAKVYQECIKAGGGDVELFYELVFNPKEGWFATCCSYYPEHHFAQMALDYPGDRACGGWIKPHDYPEKEWEDFLEHEMYVSTVFEFCEVPFSSFRSAWGFLIMLGVSPEDISSRVNDYYTDSRWILLYGDLKGYCNEFTPKKQLPYIRWNVDKTLKSSFDEYKKWMEVYRKGLKVLTVHYPENTVNGETITIKLTGYKNGLLEDFEYNWIHGKNGLSTEIIKPHLVDACITLDENYEGVKERGYEFCWGRFNVP